MGLCVTHSVHGPVLGVYEWACEWAQCGARRAPDLQCSTGDAVRRTPLPMHGVLLNVFVVVCESIASSI